MATMIQRDNQRLWARAMTWGLLVALGAAYGFWVAGDRRPPPTAPLVPLAANGQPVTFQADVRPLLAQYCYGCHGARKKGGLDLRVYSNTASVLQAREEFQKVLRNLRGHIMPPEHKPQPTPAQREMLAAWLQSELFYCDCAQPDPGRVTLRRLNRTEYNNTIRDLLGVTWQPAEDFPADDVGYGFDNIGDVLSLPPVLLEKYLASAEKVLSAVIVAHAPYPEGYRRVFIRQPAAPTPAARRDCARQIIENFARRAYRRPVRPREADRLVGFYEMAERDGQPFEQGIKLALEAVLVSPEFLFRGELEPEPNNPQAVYPIDEFALASRLSYFLWSSMPDEELFRLAGQGRLRANLEGEVRRMLADPKAVALVENFAAQWLQIRNLDVVAPDHGTFPAFDPALREAMRRETDMFCQNIMLGDRSVLEFLDADYTFANEPLARLYGLAGVKGDAFRRVSLSGTPRGGLLTMASILTITSNPTRTSPVKRGKWVLDNILGTPPPPPPPNVPPLKEGHAGELTGTLRQRMEQHRADPLCASCHARMDPIGFGFENFDGIGAWRAREGNLPIDPSGTLVSGESFQGPAGLRHILLSAKRDEFVRCLVSKFLTYALGRGLEYYDDCALDKITERLARGHYRFSSLVLGVVESVPFQLRRGETPQLVARDP